MGSGDMAQLGRGSKEADREAVRPQLVPDLTATGSKVAVGALHNFVCDANGRVLSWGCNDEGALGREGDEWLPMPVAGRLGRPQDVDGEERAAVWKVACGASHSLVLTSDERVYACGLFRDANGPMTAATPELREVAGLPTKVGIVDVAAGDHHALALDRAGRVHQWGDIGLGRRMSARNKQSSKLRPQLVRFIDVRDAASPDVVRVFAGGHSSFVLDAHGTAWAWGPCNYNQLGFGVGVSENKNKNVNVDTPAIVNACPVTGLPPLVEVACAMHHTLFLARDGRVFAVGRNDDGRLGVGDLISRAVPTQVMVGSDNEDRVVHVACGEAHSLFTTQRGHVYVCGYGDLMQLGLGHSRNVLAPTRIQGTHHRFASAHGGAQHSLLVGTRTEDEEDEPMATENEEPSPVASAAFVPAALVSHPQSSTTSTWDCQTCLLANETHLLVCRACDTPQS